MDTRYESIRHVTWTILLLVASAAKASGYHKTVHTSDTQDKTIQSEGFPGPYPTDVNITWHWRTDTGQWAVVFFDFVLDKDAVRNEDWLEIDDRDRHLRYTNATPPLKYFITEGPDLTIRFISDGKTDLQSRGFRILVLFGNTESELHLKIHDARKVEENKKGRDEDDSINWVLIICTTILALLIIIVVVVIIFIMYRRRQNSNSFDFPASPRIRRDSGISHTRNGSFQQEVRDNGDIQRQQQQQQQQQRPRRTSNNNQRRQLHHQVSGESVIQEQCSARGGRPSVQRSNSNTSQMNWILRAETSTSMSLKTADRTSKPNIYTDTPEASTSRKNSVAKSINSPELTIPYVDVLTAIPDQPSDVSHETSDYDNFESVFNTGKPLDQSPDDTPDSCDNLYTNTCFPPSYGRALSEGQNTDKKENLYSLDKPVPTRICDSVSDGAKNTNSQLTAEGSDMLYVNVHLSSSQKDLRCRDEDDNQGENGIYANIAIGLVGKQQTTPQPVSDDSLSFKGSNFSSNKIVLSVKQDSGNTSGGVSGGASAAMTHSDGAKACAIYDIPPPDSGSLKEPSGHDAYINVNDMEMASRQRSRNKPTPIVSDSDEPLPNNDTNITTKLTTVATTVIPVDKSKQTGASALYDIPRSSRK